MASYKYAPMTKGEFARTVDDIKRQDPNFTVSRAARILGIDYEELREMARGEREIPHIVRVGLSMLVLNEAMSVARMITDAVIDRSDDFNYDAKRVAGAFK